MSENTIEYYYSNKDKPKAIKSVINKVCELHKIKNKENHNIGSGKDKDKYYISMWFDDVASAPLTETLALLDAFPSDDFPYAKIWIDSTDDILYYALEDGLLMEFNSEREMNEHFDIDETTIENTFYEQIDRTLSQLFVRVRLSNKKALKALLKCSKDYIASGSQAALNDLKKEIDNDSENDEGCPFTYNYCKRNMSYNDLSAALYFADAKDNYLFLGFKFSGDVKIIPCDEEDAYYDAENNIENDDGLLILELLESILYKNNVTSLQAKFISKEKGFSGSFWSRDYILLEYVPIWGGPELPARFW